MQAISTVDSCARLISQLQCIQVRRKQCRLLLKRTRVDNDLALSSSISMHDGQAGSHLACRWKQLSYAHQYEVAIRSSDSYGCGHLIRTPNSLNCVDLDCMFLHQVKFLDRSTTAEELSSVTFRTHGLQRLVRVSHCSNHQAIMRHFCCLSLYHDVALLSVSS